MSYIIVFFVSFLCILLELFWTKMLNLKAWNHVVYTVIPFAILGYGIGANIQLIWNKKLSPDASKRLLAKLLFVLGAITLISTYTIIYLPIRVEYLLNVFVTSKALAMLLLAYTMFMLPFVLIGFVIVHIFSTLPKETHRLYFIDLLGAAMGAAAFFFFLMHFAVVHSLIVLSFASLALGGAILFAHRRWIAIGVSLLLLLFALKVLPEPVNYTVDPAKGWEWIPGYLKAQDFELISARWHPMGRTDIYKIKNADIRQLMAVTGSGTFQINIEPIPEFSYFSTNFLAGTPVYRYPTKSEAPYKVSLFSQSIEAPYVLLNEPKVFIIGTGGGRDIFMAKTHGAKEIVGAEINTETFRAMSAGGDMYEYSGRIYDWAHVKPLDGRHVVKVAPKNYYDLIVLNGVDTFSGLSSGAYAYAESFLYTKEAMIDYLNILNDNGIVVFNRWLFRPPRETLRLEAIALEALRTMGIKNPWEHIIIAMKDGWSMTIVKKTVFTDEDFRKLIGYFHSHEMGLLYPSNRDKKIGNDPFNAFDSYAEFFKQGRQDLFAANYPYDISVVTDDNPFFYKYYKFHWSDILKPVAKHHTGTVIFWTQFLVLLQATIFIIIFIMGPLILWRRIDLQVFHKKLVAPFIVYFACLGFGYMFIEISLMQKFVLILGTPICSLSVVLAALLFWTGVGSLCLPFVQRLFGGNKKNVVLAAVMAIMFFILILTGIGTTIVNTAVGWTFAARVGLVVALLAPIGFTLGIFFPQGLKIIEMRGNAGIPWAWGINCGFSVLGSMLAIILAQFMDFKAVLFLALAVYLVAYLVFCRLDVEIGEGQLK